MRTETQMRHHPYVRLSLKTWDRDAFTAAREARGWTLLKVAINTGISHGTMAAYSRGTTAPSPPALWALAQALGVATTDLAPLQDPPRLHELRWHTGLTVRELAERINISPASAGAILRGIQQPRNLSTWAGVLGVDEDTITRAWQATRADLVDDQ